MPLSRSDPNTPSSSNHNTYLERTLLAHFRRVYAHLYMTGAHQYLYACTWGPWGLGNMLDMVPAAIHRALTQSENPDLPEPLRSQNCEVVAIMHGLLLDSQAMRVCARLYEASATSYAMGDLLTEYRRVEDGEFWYWVADKLSVEAGQANEVEQRAMAMNKALAGVANKTKDVNEKRAMQMNEALAVVEKMAEHAHEKVERAWKKLKIELTDVDDEVVDDEAVDDGDELFVDNDGKPVESHLRPLKTYAGKGKRRATEANEDSSKALKSARIELVTADEKSAGSCWPPPKAYVEEGNGKVEEAKGGSNKDLKRPRFELVVVDKKPAGPRRPLPKEDDEKGEKGL